MATAAAEYDASWKHALEHYLKPFLALLFPTVHDAIDWHRPPEFQVRELARLTRKARRGRRYVDFLVKVWLRTGVECRLLLHIEVQSQRDDGLPERVYVYNNRIRDNLELPAISLAVLADADPDWRPDSWVWGQLGFELSCRFPVVKLLELGADWDRLEASTNPIATVVMAHLKSQETKDDAVLRRWWKSRLFRRLFELAYERRDILLLYEFLDGVLKLPTSLENAFLNEAEQLEQERNMPIVTSAERRGLAKGLERGLQEGMLRQLLHVLELRFGDLPADLAAVLGELAPVRLEDLMTAALSAASIDRFRAQLSDDDARPS